LACDRVLHRNEVSASNNVKVAWCDTVYRLDCVGHYLEALQLADEGLVIAAILAATGETT